MFNCPSVLQDLLSTCELMKAYNPLKQDLWACNSRLCRRLCDATAIGISLDMAMCRDEPGPWILETCTRIAHNCDAYGVYTLVGMHYYSLP